MLVNGLLSLRRTVITTHHRRKPKARHHCRAFYALRHADSRRSAKVYHGPIKNLLGLPRTVRHLAPVGAMSAPSPTGASGCLGRLLTQPSSCTLPRAGGTFLLWRSASNVPRPG